MYIPQFKVVVIDGEKHLVLNALNGKNNGPDYDCGVISAEDWFNLRIEIKYGDGTQDPNTGTRMSVYIDDVQIYSGSDFWGVGNGKEKPDISSVYQVLIIPIDGATGTIYFDNTVFK